MSQNPARLHIALAAIRPKTLPAAGAPVLVGGALAFAHGFVGVWPWAAALMGALLIQMFDENYALLGRIMSLIYLLGAVGICLLPRGVGGEIED